MIAAVFVRDSFTCRYCARWTIPNQILRLISAALPADFPFDPHWRRDITPRAYWDISTSIDHIQAVSTGGDFQDPANLATACARCQYQKSNRPLGALGWELAPPSKLGAWDGAVRAYEALWDATGRPDARHHRGWIRLFAAALSNDGASTEA
ncbi:MAG: HNH endonuclease [Solirubrobacteraceae bacterium]